MFGFRKKDEEKFKEYYERKRMRKYSFFNAVREAYSIIFWMMLGMMPAFLLPFYAYELGVWTIIILILYIAFLLAATYAVYWYRSIVEIRGYFTKEEFEAEFKNELWLLRFMDKISRFLIN